ncbi:hypothetical protein [Rhodococcus zopfii]|uniref:hypothetical protein n=1 Tax=Rhodococcus zopfii TaxID=43772 RepID=UPI0014766C33|nr:hypothetical protein [Rhodococcus zopfii]
MIEDQLLTEVLAATPLPDMALEAALAGIPLRTGKRRGPDERGVDITWGRKAPNLWSRESSDLGNEDDPDLM